MFTSFIDLLEQGVYNIDRYLEHGESGITGIDTSFGMDIIKEINEFMYTTYSTNVGDETLTIEGILLHSDYVRIKPYLKDLGYWFIVQNLQTLEIIYSHVGKNRNKTKLERISIDKKDLDIYKIEPGKWMIERYHNDKVILCRQRNIFFMCDDAMKEILHSGLGGEVLEYTDTLLFSSNDPLVGIFIEDPSFKEDLYIQLLNILSNIHRD